MSGASAARPFILERREEMPDGAGGFTEVWTALGTLWGEMAPLGRVRSVGERVAMRTRLRVRAAPPGDAARPEPGQRLREGERVFVIEAVQEVKGAPLWLDCTLSEEVAK